MEDSGYIIYGCDTETTGMDFNLHEVVEVSFSRFTLDKPDEKEQKTWFLKATCPETIQDEALAKNGHKKEEILHFTKKGQDKYQEPSEAIAEIEAWIMDDFMSAHDRIMMGQNIKFDVGMLQALWKRHGHESTFPFNLENDNRVVDTKLLATIIDMCLGKRRRFYNLGTLVKAFHVKKRKAHRAEDDTAMTVDLFLNMLLPILPAIKEAFKDNYTDEDM